jgi:hypothetical protein
MLDILLGCQDVLLNDVLSECCNIIDKSPKYFTLYIGLRKADRYILL